MFLGKDVLKICRKFAGKHPCRCVISIKLQSNFIQITLRLGCSPLNLLYDFRKPFYKNISGGLLLEITILLSLLLLLKYYFTNFTNYSEYHFLFKFRDSSISTVIIFSYSKQFFSLSIFFAS